MAAVAESESGVSYTEVEETRDGQAKVLYNFDGRTINELSLKKVECGILVDCIPHFFWIVSCPRGFLTASDTELWGTDSESKESKIILP